MNLRKGLFSGGVSASLLASLLVIGASGTAFAATAMPVTTTVVPNGTATTLPLATVTATAPGDFPAGTITITLPTGYSWAASGTIATTVTGGTLAVTAGAITAGGTTATFTLSGTTITGSTIAFSSPTVSTTTAGAHGDVVLSGLSNPAAVVVARVTTPGKSGERDNDHGKGRDQDRGKGHGARKVAFFNAPSNFTCATGAQPAAGDPTYGFAILNTTGHHKLIVNVVLKGALPSATYDLWVNQYPGACPLSAATKVGAVHTNARGNGTGHLSVTIVSGATDFWVSATSGSSVLRTRAAVLTIKH
ncbi:MAG TPA: hypothetical protein VFG00_04900 [Acidothermaceae bacterium]|nr:hypothetical protein [Acidothermaceae bacterium]